MTRAQSSGQALGSDVILTIRGRDQATDQLIFQALWAQIQAFERRFSRFMPDSELSTFNARAGEETPISAPFHELLEKVEYYRKSTGGLYDPFVLPALNRAGYIGSWPNPESYHEHTNYASRLRTIERREISISPRSARVPRHTALDFGGIGKGYLLDQLAAYLHTEHVKDYWLSLGGDIICAGFDNQNQPWKIGLAHATLAAEIVAYLENDTGKSLALATSGITKRKGPNWHHIIDPRTDAPADTDVLTASVSTTSATSADVFAKCLVIGGSAAAPDFIESRDTIAAALLQISHNDSVILKKYGTFA